MGRLDDSHMGKRVRCRKCGEGFVPSSPQDLPRAEASAEDTGSREVSTTDIAWPIASRTVPLLPNMIALPGYRLLNRLGSDGFSEVWKAEALGGFAVALKFIPVYGRMINFESTLSVFLKHLHHPNILNIFNYWHHGDWLVIGMELADHSLQDRFHQATSQGLPGIPNPELSNYILQAAMGIDYLNQLNSTGDDAGIRGIQHRDVKPQNLLLVGDSVKVVVDFDVAALVDFDVTAPLDPGRTSLTRGMTGNFAAPAMFEREVSPYSDQYSLAVTYCQLRIGRFPFPPRNEQALRHAHLNDEADLSGLPDAERLVVARALAKQPKEHGVAVRNLHMHTKGERIEV